MKDHAGRLLRVAIALVTFVVSVFGEVQAVTPTPEPATVLLIGGGLGALVLIARRKRARK